ncbi:MAG: sigma-70 family RNA polymerase sigma factor [Planctomycetaceae bacterium]|nr:sigma-70 family RNA polymerase sigma factor [Planctomycetaceae bacterium]
MSSILSPEAVTHLWAKHSPVLVLYARQWCHVPEDVVQEAFLLLTRQAIAPQNPVGWLYQVVRNSAINAARSGRRRSRRETIAASKSDPWFEPSLDERLDAAAATEAMTQLPLAQREAIVARLWGGLSFDEIARLSGSSAATVHRRYWRGIAALRERLDKSCPTATRQT